MNIKSLLSKLIGNSFSAGFTPLEITRSKNKHKKSKSLTGFTFLEVIIAIFVITVGLMGGMSAIQRAISLPSVSSSRLVATYLAQEGIELVRNIRDGNWLEARTTVNAWDEGLTGCVGSCSIDYKHSYGPNQQDPILPGYTDTPLQIDTNGYYIHPSGFSSTKFKRKITISKSDQDTLNVVAEVNWTEKGVVRSLSIQGTLYDWR